jgi:RNA polymerase II subunit A small phosphatase-like protein
MKEVKPVAPASDAKPAHQAEVPGVTGATVLESGEKDIAGQTQPGEEVVVAPQELHTAPVDEVSKITSSVGSCTNIQTAGLTSSAVQAPGSGSALLATPVRPSSSRRQSESSPSAAGPDAERTDTSGGYSAISESEVPDSSSGSPPPHAEDEYGLEDEYEDEEDRLIAQGGMGIPVDEVSQLPWSLDPS